MTPYRYPRDKHFRRLKPGPFSRHQDYKPFLREEFESKCVYCREPDTLAAAGPEGFGVDHYKPKSKFPRLQTDYKNLFYCCNPCNQRKGTYWPSSATLKTRFIPNPCDHEMGKHVRFEGANVVPRSTAGETLVEVLDLNDPKMHDHRVFVNHLVAIHEIMIGDLEGLAEQLLAARSSADVAGIHSIDVDLKRVEGSLTAAKSHLLRLLGK